MSLLRPGTEDSEVDRPWCVSSSYKRALWTPIYLFSKRPSALQTDRKNPESVTALARPHLYFLKPFLKPH